MNIKTDIRGLPYDACNAHISWATGEVFQVVDEAGDYDEAATIAAQDAYRASLPPPEAAPAVTPEAAPEAAPQ